MQETSRLFISRPLSPSPATYPRSDVGSQPPTHLPARPTPQSSLAAPASGAGQARPALHLAEGDSSASDKASTWKMRDTSHAWEPEDVHAPGDIGQRREGARYRASDLERAREPDQSPRAHH